MLLYAVTAKKLCTDDFLTRIEAIAAAGADRIILREKELPVQEYRRLAAECQRICHCYGSAFSVNSFVQEAERLRADLHVPLSVLEQNPTLPERFPVMGVSVHSVDEAAIAKARGASYLIAGHIFATDCKKGLTPRGLSFLREITERVDLPVMAIGGIAPDNVGSVQQAGAAGVCVMSGLMTCPLEQLPERIWLLKS